MATYTLTTQKNWDEVTYLYNDTVNITSGKLTIDTDTRYCANHTAANGILPQIDMSTSALHGEVLIDGTKVRIIPFDSGSGNVPAIGTSIIQGGVSGYLLGVWSALNVAPTTVGSTMPASGWIKIKNKTGGSYIIGALSGITANATGADVVGWIEIAGGPTYYMRAGGNSLITTTGEWFYAGTTNGSAGQQIQLPASLTNTYYGGVYIETGVGTDLYDFYPSAGIYSTANTFANEYERGRIVWISVQGLVTIGSDGTNTQGYVPISGCKVRVPNIVTVNTTGATNTAPTTTITNRYTILTINGSINLDKINLLWYLGCTSKGTNISMTNSIVIDGCVLKSFVEPIIISNCGIGASAFANSTGLASLQITNSPATITNLTIGKYDAGAVIQGCMYIYDSDFPITFTNSRIMVWKPKTTIYSGVNLSRCSDVTFTTTKIFGQGFYLIGCSGVTLTNTSYADGCYGSTRNYNSFAFEINDSNTNTKIDGVDFFGLSDINPKLALISLTGHSCDGLDIRNIGTYANHLPAGTTYPCGALMRGTNLFCNSNISVKRVYTDFDYSVSFTDYTYTGWVIQNLSSITMTCTGINSIFKGILGDVSSMGDYGTSFADCFTSTSVGKIILNCKSKNTAISSNYEVIQGGSGFGFFGNLVMPNIGDEVIWTWPHYIIGHTSFTDVAPTITGTNYQDLVMTYQPNQGSGFGVDWKLLYYYEALATTNYTSDYPTITLASTAHLAIGDHIYSSRVTVGTKIQSIDSATQITMDANALTSGGANTIFSHLAEEIITDPSFGIKFKVKAKVKPLASATVYLGNITIPTSCTIQTQAYQYPLDTVEATLSLTNLVADSQIYVYHASTNELITSGTSVNGAFTYNYIWVETDTPINIYVYNSGMNVYQLLDQSLTQYGLTIPVVQQTSGSMKILQIIGGLPRTLSTSLNYYDATTNVTTEIGVTGTNYDADHLVFTLPNSETYDGTVSQLEVKVNGVKQIPGSDFNFVSNAQATTVTFTYAIDKNWQVNFRLIY